MKFDTPADHQPDRPAQGRRQADRPHRRPAQDHRHRALRLRAARRRAQRRPTATSSAPASPRAASRRSTLRAAQGRAGRARRSSPRDNAGKLGKGEFNTAKLLGGPEIEHYHQAIALVVAETFEQARAAAQLVRVDYDATPGKFDLAAEKDGAPAAQADRLRRPAGNRRSATSPAPSPPRRCKLDATYTTPDQSHAMMEPHATIAAWDGDKLTRLDLEPDDRLERAATWPRRSASRRRTCALISPFIGGGFGGKLFVRADARAGGARRARGGAAGQGGAAAAADAQQHHAPAGDDPAHPHRRRRATARSPPSRTRAGRATCPAAGPETAVNQTRLLYAGAEPHDRRRGWRCSTCPRAMRCARRARRRA